MRAHAIGAATGLLLLGLATVDGRQTAEPDAEPSTEPSTEPGTEPGTEPSTLPSTSPVEATESAGRSPRNANYEIDVQLDHAARTLTGRETIRWRNISANATSELQFHLYWNAWRNLESTWLRERRLAGSFTPRRDDAWSSIDVTRLRWRMDEPRTTATVHRAG